MNGLYGFCCSYLIIEVIVAIELLACHEITFNLCFIFAHFGIFWVLSMHIYVDLGLPILLFSFMHLLFDSNMFFWHLLFMHRFSWFKSTLWGKKIKMHPIELFWINVWFTTFLWETNCLKDNAWSRGFVFYGFMV
jgi:hypothetical protein